MLAQARATLNRPVVWFTAGILVAHGRYGFAHPIGNGWPDDLLDLLGVGVVGIGSFFFAMVSTSHIPRAGIGIRNPGGWAIAAGVALILGKLRLALLLLAPSALLLSSLLRQSGLWPSRSIIAISAARWRQIASKVVSRAGIQVCWACGLALLVEVWEDATKPGGPKPHLAELSAYGVVFAVLGILWAARKDGRGVLHPAVADLPPFSSALNRTLGLVAAFAGVTLATRLSCVQALDESLLRRLYLANNGVATVLVRGVSNTAGGWLPCCVLMAAVALYVLGRGRSLRFFISVIVGAMALSGALKTLIHRTRPAFASMLHPPQPNSYPSGHVLAATTLAIALMVICLPPDRKRGAWLRTALSAWIVLVSVSRVYLGQHYPTDVLGGVLLGAAWVSFCYTLLLTTARSQSTCAESVPQPEPTSPDEQGLHRPPDEPPL